MPVTHFITHRVSKDSQKPSAITQCREQEQPVDEYCHMVMSQLKQIFIGRASKRYGRFDPERPTVRGLTQNWLQGQQDFTGWSSRITNLFTDQMDNTDLAIDGYLVFIAEEIADGDRLYMFHLREKSNVTLTEDFTLSETRYIDFSNTGFGLCIDTTLMQTPDADKPGNEYFTFSFGRGEKQLQNLFCDFSGFTDTVNTEQETQEFLSIVEEYTQTLPAEAASETREKVISYCMEQDKLGEPVEFREISGQLDDSAPEKFESFVVEKRRENRSQPPATENESDIATPDPDTAEKTEFIPDRKSLKNYIRYSGKNKDVTLSFSASALGKDINFDAGNNTLTIQNLPDKLLKQLKS